MEKEAVQEFKPLLISFNEEAYKSECRIAEQKLELLEQSKRLALEHIKEVKLKQFAGDMVTYLKEEIIKVNSEMIKLGLSENKVLYLLDKEEPLKKLEALQIQYESISAELSWRKDEPSIRVEKEKFSKWTKSEEQNIKLTAIKNLIASAEQFEKHFRLAKGLIPQMTNQAVTLDFRKQKLQPNTILF